MTVTNGHVTHSDATYAASIIGATQDAVVSSIGS
jgi:hypothetical protein